MHNYRRITMINTPKKLTLLLTLGLLSVSALSNAAPNITKSKALANTQEQNSKTLVAGTSIDGSPIETIQMSKKGKLYIGTDRGFVYFYDAKTHKWNKAKNEFDNSNIFSIYFDAENNLYVGTQGGHIYLQKANSNTWQDITFNLGGKSIWTISGNKDNLYVLSNDLVHRYDASKSTWVAYPIDKDAVRFSSMLVDPDNKLYAGSTTGKAWLWQDNKWVEVGKPIPNLHAPLWNLLHKDNTLFAGAENGEVYQYNPKDDSWHVLGNPSLSKLDGSRIWDLDLENNALYAQTDTGKIFKYVNGKWKNIPYGPQNNNSAAWSVMPDHHGDLYVGTNDDGLYKISVKSGKATKLSTQTQD